MRWRRAIVATLIGSVVMVAVSRMIYFEIFGVIHEATVWAMPWASANVWAPVTEIAAVSFVVGPSVFVAVLIYGLGKPFTDTETRCRRCGYILRGLTELRCPECGEGI